MQQRLIFQFNSLTFRTQPKPFPEVYFYFFIFFDILDRWFMFQNVWLVHYILLLAFVFTSKTWFFFLLPTNFPLKVQSPCLCSEFALHHLITISVLRYSVDWTNFLLSSWRFSHCIIGFSVSSEKFCSWIISIHFLSCFETKLVAKSMPDILLTLLPSCGSICCTLHHLVNWIICQDPGGGSSRGESGHLPIGWFTIWFLLPRPHVKVYLSITLNPRLPLIFKLMCIIPIWQKALSSQ